ncbi:hypothetical protein QE152_g36287 [Popillia japonica]|uniref:Uncharacterized protein n=1 Tax=Popillia japonica TaxID=7064 RepID=A0AAW1ID58_POPJA
MADNENNLHEEGKRKKREEIYVDGFHKSKKMFRTPDKIHERKAEDENMGEMKEILREILHDSKIKTKEIEEMKDMMSSLMQEIKAVRTENIENRQEIAKLRTENEQLKKEFEIVDQKLQAVEITTERYQRDSKKDNLVIKGLAIDTNDNETIRDRIQNFLKQELAIDSKTASARKLFMTCVIKMQDFENKMKILKAKRRKRRTHQYTLNAT